MELTQILQNLSGTVAGFGALAVAGVTAWYKVQAAIAPILSRRKIKIGIVANQERDSDARKFFAGLRKAGYRQVALTRDPSACLGRQAIVMWQPEAESAQSEIERAQSVAPEATILVYTTTRLQVRLGPSVLLANSPLRVASDLTQLAEIRL